MPDLSLQARKLYGLDFGGTTACGPGPTTLKYTGGSNFQIYVTPVCQDQIGIALLTRDSRLRLDSALGEFPELRIRLDRAEASSRDRGAVTVSRRLRRVFRGRTVLIGDASGSVDAIAGEGLSLSFHQALALSDSLCSGDLASYQAEHSRLRRRPALVANLLLSLDRFPLLRRRTLKLLTLGSPILAKSFEYTHTGLPDTPRLVG